MSFKPALFLLFIWSLLSMQEEKAVTTVYLIGDSTMADYSNNYDEGKDYMKTRYPVTGWGQVFQQFLVADSLPKLRSLIKGDTAIVDNRARGGRSTRTFFQEGRWRSVYEGLKKDDVVLMQFGHNDAAENKPERYVDLEGYKEFLRLFINQTRQKKAQPIILTPVARNYPWENGQLENVHGEYDQAVKDVAKELNVPLIDLNQSSREHFSKVGRDYVTEKYFMNLPAGVYEAYPDGQKDNTHFQPEGATAIARLVFEAMQDLKKDITPQPYTIETTYEKLKKHHPFISPIEPLKLKKIQFKENVTYRTVEGKELQADIYYPRKKTSRKRPAVLLIHGGGWISGSKENQRIMAQHLAKNGYVAMTAAYTLSDLAPYPASVLDLKAAVRWLKEHSEEYGIDPDKIAVLGASAGAQLATLIGVTPDSPVFREGTPETSDEVQAIVNIDGIVSFIHPDAEESEIAGKWLGGLQHENPENWKEASPLEYVDENTPPIIFINSSQPRFHAGRDDLIEILDRHNIYSEVHTIPESPHSFWLMQPWFKPTLKYTLNFLDKTLKNEN